MEHGPSIIARISSANSPPQIVPAPGDDCSPSPFLPGRENLAAETHRLGSISTNCMSVRSAGPWQRADGVGEKVVDERDGEGGHGWRVDIGRVRGWNAHAKARWPPKH